tara:strand:- start:2570 stop:3364 length:795 start_codon:yes stop_codon:yes gene_type:complete
MLSSNDDDGVKMETFFKRLLKGFKNPIQGFLYILGTGWKSDKVESSLLSNSPIDFVVHVGGHLAQELDLYRILGVQHIVWIEADPSTFVKLEKKLKILEAEQVKKIKHTVINATISDEDGKEVDFYVFNNKGGSSSIKKPGKLMSKTYPHLSVIGEPLRLKTSRLDTILSSIHFSKNKSKKNLLVLDIQGNEGAALKGLGDCHKMFSMIQSEISRKALYQDSTMFIDIDGWMKERDFKLLSHSYLYIPWHCDVVYQKKSFDLTY